MPLLHRGPAIIAVLSDTVRRRLSLALDSGARPSVPFTKVEHRTYDFTGVCLPKCNGLDVLTEWPVIENVSHGYIPPSN